MDNRERTKKENDIKLFEWKLKVTFPQSYRQFLLNREEIERKAGFRLPVFGLPRVKKEPEKEKRKGIILSFQPGDPKRGSFSWISNYQGRIVGLCTLPHCQSCNLEERKKLVGFQGGELEVELKFYQREKRGFYIAHLISIPDLEENEEWPRMSVLEATEFLKVHRPDLKEEKLVCVRFIGDWAVCLDLREKPEDDSPLVTVSLKNKEIPITQTHHSFREAVEEAIKSWKRTRAARQRVANRREEAERRRHRELSHMHKKGQPYPLYPGPRDWHPLIRRAHDDVVGRTAFRYNTRLDALEVDEFYAPDHPEYEEGDPLRNLLISIFGAAHDLGGSLNIIFTKDIRENEETGKIRDRNWQRFLPALSPELRKEAKKNKGRVPRPVPQELVELAEKYGVTFQEAQKGKISHQEGVELFLRLFEFPAEVREKINDLVGKGYFTKEALCFVLATNGTCDREEAIWFFLNDSWLRPEAIIFGTDAPESRLLHSQSVNWGRAVYLTSLLKRKIEVDLSGGLSEEERTGVDCRLEPREEFWVLRANQGFNLPWQIKGSELVWVEPEEPVLILSRPQQTSQPEIDKAWLREKIEYLAKVESEAKVRCLLLSFEFSDLKYGMEVSEEMKAISREAAEKGVYLLFSPFKLDILNDKAEERMARARRLKHFEPRISPLKLQLIEVPKEVWQEPALRFSVEDALSAASWIAKRIDLRLGRIRFQTNCQVIERIALQDQRNKKIAEFDGAESKELLEVLKSEKGITLPFVQPEDLPQFLEKSGKGRLKSALAKIQDGIIVVVPPYEKLVAEPEVKPTERPVIIPVPADFQFPVNPEEIDFNKYRQGYRRAEIQRFHKQIQEALRTGQPLAVSYLPHELFPEVIRDYIYYTAYTEYYEVPFLFFKRKYERRREPSEPAMLRIVYNDGTEGEPFPLFCLSKAEKSPESSNFYEFKIGSISMRHVNLDFITEGYLMTNMMIRRKGRESAAAQEDYAFRMTWHFLTNFVDLIQHKRVEEITQEVKFRFLWNWLKEIRERSYEGLKLHIFQTGLEPAVVGMYRAVIKFLQQRRGELVVVPRLIISEKLWNRLKEEKGIEIKGDSYKGDYYIEAEEWL